MGERRLPDPKDTWGRQVWKQPPLVQNGMLLVDLDIVGDKLMEINVFSPGGLGSAQQFERANFNEAVIEALARKVAYMGH